MQHQGNRAASPCDLRRLVRHSYITDWQEQTTGRA